MQQSLPPVPTKGVVKLGDTLFKIAQRYGMSMQEILRLNPGLDTARLVASTEIQLVQSQPLTSAKPACLPANSLRCQLEALETEGPFGPPRPSTILALRTSTSGGLGWPDPPQFQRDKNVPSSSALIAWHLNRQGQLELRTSPNVQLLAFYEAGTAGRGPRVWIDLPGAPGRSRTISGSGSIQEVRIGRPDAGTTRMVMQFVPGTRLNPADLHLVSTAQDRWSMNIKGLDRLPAVNLGEGDMALSPQPEVGLRLRPAIQSPGMNAKQLDRYQQVIEGQQEMLRQLMDR